MSLGEFIKEKRKAKGLTQTELSEHTGISRTTISELELDEISRPSGDALAKLAKELDVAVKDIFAAADIKLPTTPAREKSINEFEEIERDLSKLQLRIHEAVKGLKRI